MPTSLPVRTSSKPKSKSFPRHQQPQLSADGLSVWAVGVGIVACFIAAFIYFSGRDQVGAAMVLALSAVVILAVWRAGSDAREI